MLPGQKYGAGRFSQNVLRRAAQNHFDDAPVAVGADEEKVVIALAVVAYLSFQRLGSGPLAPPFVPSPVAIATPARPAGQQAPTSVPAIASTAIPTPVAANLFVACDDAVKGADWANAGEACE